MWPALPAPDYYGGSAPPGPSAVGAPIPASGQDARRREPARTVPVFTVIRSAEEEPGCVPAASPWVRRRLSPWPPGAAFVYLPEVPAALAGSGTRCARPPSARFEPVAQVKDVMTPVPRVLLSATLAGPAPSGSTKTSRPCQGCSRPPRHHADQAALSFSDLLRQAAGEGLPPPLGSTAPHGANGNCARATRTWPLTPIRSAYSHR
jgi:hypothetical protein